MARRYGSSSGSRCFNSYYGSRPVALSSYANTVVFTAVYLAMLVTLLLVRKKAGAGRRLIGLTYIAALALTFILYIYQLIISTLSACEALDDNISAVYDTNIASLVLDLVRTMLFLFVVFYLLNMMLRKQLGQNLSALRIIFGIDLLVLAVLLLAQTAILCQYYYWAGRSYYSPTGANLAAAVYITVAFDAVQVLSILVSGVLAVLAVKSLKRKNMAQNSLLIWVTVLHFSLLVSAVWSLAATAGQLNGGIYYEELGYTVMSWISSLFYALAFISVILIARNPVWGSTAFTEAHGQQQYAYHQDAPVYEGAQRA